MNHKTKPAAASLAPTPTPTHFVQEHQGLCILALPASFRKAVPAERWDEIHRELHAQVLVNRPGFRGGRLV